MNPSPATDDAPSGAVTCGDPPAGTYGCAGATPPPSNADRGPTPPPNTPRRARSVSVTDGIITAAAARVERLGADPAAPGDRDGPPGRASAESGDELDYVEIPPGFTLRPAHLRTAALTAAPYVPGAVASPPAAPPAPTTPTSRAPSNLSNTEPDRRARKRARFESASPTPPHARTGRLARTTLSLHARQPSPTSSSVAPAGWRRPTARVDRPAWVQPGDTPSPPEGPFSATPVWAPTGPRQPLERPTAPRPIPSTGIPRGERPPRADEENTPPDDPLFDMDLDLQLMTPLPNGRTAADAGLPLSVLDFNRNRFPTALSPTGPINPEAFEAAWPSAAANSAPSSGSTTLVPSTGSTWAPGQWPVPPNDVPGTASGTNRPPTPYPRLSTAEALPVPATPFGSLAASLRFPPPALNMPPPPPTSDGRSLSRTATYTASGHTAALPSLPTGPSFTPTPVGGFPEVVTNEPDGLLAGFPRARVAALADPATGESVAVQVYNAGFPTPRDLRPMSGAITEAVQAVTGELTFLLVPPEVEWAVPQERRPEPPITWIVLGLSHRAITWLTAQRVMSTPAITLFFYRPTTSVPRFLFLAGGFAHDHNNSVMHAVWTVFSGPRVLPGILNLAQTNSAYIGIPPEEVARTILGSLEVRVTTLRNGNVIAAVFCDSPTSSPPRWREWRDSIARLPFPSSFNSTGFARRAGRCHGCHGADHPTYLCPFQDVPGWNAPPPGAHWGQTGVPREDGLVNSDTPPGPPPPPAGTRGGPSARGGAYPRGGAQPRNALGKRDRRDRPGGSAGSATGNASAPLF